MTTTSYGTWLNATGTLNVASYIAEAFDSEGTDGFDVDAIERDYREAIDEALPHSVHLVGDEFIGPYWAGSRPAREGESRVLDVDIKAVVEGVDFWAIVEKHHIGV